MFNLNFVYIYDYHFNYILNNYTFYLEFVNEDDSIKVHLYIIAILIRY